MDPISSDRPFYTFLREERQFSFLLAFLLMQKGKALERFLELVSDRLLPPEAPIPPFAAGAIEGAEVYVEFAYLRDRWDAILSDKTRDAHGVALRARDQANEEKRDFICQLFQQLDSLASLAASELPASIAAFNAFFMGDAGSRITRDIASPALWSVKSLKDRFSSSPEMFLDLCRLKWSFRIKPDVVIAIEGIPTLCIEAKLESNEGTYPTGEEAGLFDEVFVVQPKKRVRQFELQRFMFEQLLGWPIIPVVIQKGKPRSQAGAPLVLTWGEVLSSLATVDELEKAIPFVSRIIADNLWLNTRERGEQNGSFASAPLANRVRPGLAPD